MEAKESRHWIYTVGLCLLCYALGMLAQRCIHPPCEDQVLGTTSDTVKKRDTIRPGIPAKPQSSVVIRRDKIKPAKAETIINGVTGLPIEKSEAQSVTIDSAGVVSIPITSVEYIEDDFKATVEGYIPALTCIELYPLNTTITNTVTKYKPPRWAITIGPYAGYDGKFSSGIAVNFGFVLWSNRPRK